VQRQRHLRRQQDARDLHAGVHVRGGPADRGRPGHREAGAGAVAAGARSPAGAATGRAGRWPQTVGRSPVGRSPVRVSRRDDPPESPSRPGRAPERRKVTPARGSV
jgi:hypothetical protein